ncbi:MAG: DUF86 domain-containing protein [bacterium]|nr:DUF86 domain-containing protein [bacterium]
MNRDIRLFVKDILDSINKINEFVRDMSFDDFVDDDKTSSAVIKKLEIIGEATKNIPKGIQDNYPQIPWSDMARMRDKIIHFYHGVDYEIVWKVVKERLPEIKPYIEDILATI